MQPEAKLKCFLPNYRIISGPDQPPLVLKCTSTKCWRAAKSRPPSWGFPLERWSCWLLIKPLSAHAQKFWRRPPLAVNNTYNQFQTAVARLACETFILLQMNNHLRELGDPGVSLAAQGERQAVSAQAAPVCVSDFLLISLFVLLHFRDEGCLWKNWSTLFSTLRYPYCLI